MASVMNASSGHNYWDCTACTLRNIAAHTVCSACYTKRGGETLQGIGGGGGEEEDWVCTACTCINSILLSECDACTSPRVHGSTKVEVKTTTTKGGETWVCVKCTFVNEISVDKCIICEEGTKPVERKFVTAKPSGMLVKEGADVIFEKKVEEKKVEEIVKWKVGEKVVEKKVEVREEKKVEVKEEKKIEAKAATPIVEKIVELTKVEKIVEKKIEVKKHVEEEEEEEEEEEGGEEEEDYEMQGEQEEEGEELVDEYADYENAYADEAYEAMCDIPYETIIQNPAEVDKKKAFLPPVNELQALTILNPMQTKALKHIVDASRNLSKAAHVGVEARAKRLGYTAEQLQDTLRYIRDSAPILIHVKIETYLDKLFNDTHYRNQFETNTSGGTLSRPSRVQWEDRIFNSLYSASSDFDRVKYGVLNITRDPNGVRTCSNYGDSYFLLKNVRLRCTFASCDTSNASVQISCCEYYEHVLATYTDIELGDLIAVATDPQGLMWKANTGQQYKEIQIHGPVELAKNIEAVVVNAKHRGNKELIALLTKFAAKNKCNILWMDELR